jgi:hypothetical protein
MNLKTYLNKFYNINLIIMKAVINGFPELLPEEQILMNNRIEDSKKIFENY